MYITSKNNRLYLTLVLNLLFLTSFTSNAMSLSTYRIYLDNDNSTASFVMYNKSIVAESCQLSLVHNDFDETGQLTQLDDDIVPENSAKPWIRFSPKNFTADGRSPQTVRFTLRRKANTQPAEYRSYLEVYCDQVEDTTPKSATTSELPTIGVKPRLVQNVPIVVRTGKLNAEISFSKMSIDNKYVHFTVNRKGDRSVYGDIELVNKNNGEVLGFTSNNSLYTETTSTSHKLGFKNIPVDQLALRFVEDKKYGGTITHQQDVIID
ncbi:hypothetical protein [Paraglaciecola sp. L3A3]|uniref:hypothetical protein n=1 Tax=Paraglaciecola sp. L3A3 TaxID=2686358 RepID=UPI00131B059A|nr:hypothetical protein [Paraglaciecola sp. L3A3]